MASRFTVIPVPDLARDLIGARRVIDQNFQAINDLLNRAIMDGSILATGTVTEAHLTTAAKTLIGDVTGTIGASGSTTVVKIRGKGVDAPAIGNDGNLLAYNHTNSDFDWVDCLRDVLTTRGDLIVRGAAAESRLAVGAVNTVLKSDGTDPSWTTVTLLLDVIGATQGNVLYRGAAGWAVLAPGTSGDFLKTLGAGADPAWAALPAGAAHNLLSATHSDTTAAACVRGDLITGQAVSPLWKRLAIGTAGQFLTSDGTDVLWGAAPAGAAHNLLSVTHSDTTAAACVRGDLITGQAASPLWKRLARGTRRYLLGNDGTDVVWDDPKRFGMPSFYCLYSRGSFAYGLALTGEGVEGTIGGSGTLADAADADRAASKWTNATTGVIGWRIGIGVSLVQARHRPYMRFDMKLTDNVDGCTWAGFAALAAGSTLADPAVVLAAFRARNTTDTNFQACTHDGATLGTTDTGVAIDTAWHDFEVFTDDAGVTWYFYIDGTLVATRTTNVPGTSTAMQPQAMMAAVTSTARDMASSYCSVFLGKPPTV